MAILQGITQDFGRVQSATAVAVLAMGDLLAAAMCYSLSEDVHASARCLRQAAADAAKR